MRSVVRRLSQLEAKYVPRVDLVAQQIVEVIREGRRRRLEASGQPCEDHRTTAPAGPGACMSLAETFRLRRAARAEVNRRFGICHSGLSGSRGELEFKGRSSNLTYQRSSIQY